MGLFGVRVNGIPRWQSGSTSAPIQTKTGLAVNSSAGAVTVYHAGTPTAADQELVALRFTANFGEVGTEKVGSGSSRAFRVKSANAILFNTAGADAWQVDASAGNLRPASSAVTPQIGSSVTPIGNVYLAAAAKLDFGQTVSTFAQTATMTNGPRAANPVTWVEVSYNGGASTGRMPIW